MEFAILGSLSGLLGASTSEAIAWALFNHIFEISPRFHWQIWAAAPLLGALAIGIFGYLHTRNLVRVSPVQILREL
jgi:putative ABC transport system permease protein